MLFFFCFSASSHGLRFGIAREQKLARKHLTHSHKYRANGIGGIPQSVIVAMKIVMFKEVAYNFRTKNFMTSSHFELTMVMLCIGNNFLWCLGIFPFLLNSMGNERITLERCRSILDLQEMHMFISRRQTDYRK